MRAEAISYMETCLEESYLIQNCGEIDEDIQFTSTFSSLLPRGQLLLARWVAADVNFPKARYLAGQIDENSEFAEEAQQILHALAHAEDGGNGA